MSADNWTTCPRCIINQERKIEKKTKQLNSQYGIMNKDKWLKLREEIKALRNPTLYEIHTLREDYEIGIGEDDNVFQIIYRCSCNNCNFKFQYKYRETVS